VTIRALLLPCGLLLALASAASAQSVNAPPPAIDPPATANVAPPPPPAPPSQAGLPPQRIVGMVRASGFDPIGRPVRHGNLYAQRAIDPNGVEYRLVIDSLTGRFVSVRAVGIAGPYAAAGYGPYPPPPPQLYGRYFPPPESGFGYRSPRPPRNVPNAHLPPPQPPANASTPPRPQPSTTAQAPLPRPKPYVMEATGSIPADSPKTPAPPKTSEPPKPAAQANGAVEMPPVAPLN